MFTSPPLPPHDVAPLQLGGRERRRVLVVDNHDSFTYNLVQLLATLGAECTVVLSDAPLPKARTFDAVLLSPGPCGPEQSGSSLEALRGYAGRLPILGVCLGHQVIAHHFGARVVRIGPVHGKTSEIHHDGRGLFAGVTGTFSATRYHSLAVDPESVPESLEISAHTADGVVMGLRHRELPVEALQFHPESIASSRGEQLLRNWLDAAVARADSAAT